MDVKAIILHDVKAKAAADPLQPSGALVEGVLRDVMNDAPCALPRVSALTRMANRRRQKDRPKDPVDLHFNIDNLHFDPAFFKADVQVLNVILH